MAAAAAASAEAASQAAIYLAVDALLREGHTFTGSALVEEILRAPDTPIQRRDAVSVASELLRSGRMRRVDGRAVFEDNSSIYAPLSTTASEASEVTHPSRGAAASVVADVAAFKFTQALHGVSVCIPCTSVGEEATGTARFTLYLLSVTAGGTTWTVPRRYRAFRELHASLSAAGIHPPPLPPKKYSGSLSPQFIEERRQALEAYMQSVVGVPSTLALPAVLEFLDDATSSPLRIHLALTDLNSRIAVLESAYDEAQLRFAAYEDVIANQREALAVALNRNRALEAVLAESALGGGAQSTASPVLTSTSGEMKRSPSKTSLARGASSPLVTAIPRVPSSSSLSRTTAAAAPAGGAVTASTPTPRPALVSPASLSRSELSAAIVALTPTSTCPSELDLRCDALIASLMPTAETDRLRGRVEAYICTLLKRALGAQVFAVGAHPTRTFLDDDPVGLSAFLCLGQERTWFTRVAEVLFSASAGASSQASTVKGTVVEGDGIAGHEDDDDSCDGMLTVASALSGRRRRMLLQALDAYAGNTETGGKAVDDDVGGGTLSAMERLGGLLNRAATLESAMAVSSLTGSVRTVTSGRNPGGDAGAESPTVRTHTPPGLELTAQATAALQGSGAISTSPLYRVRAVAFMSGRVKRITAEVDDMTVSVSANQLHELCQVAIVEAADASIGRAHLFKRSLLLFRAWARADSGRPPPSRPFTQAMPTPVTEARDAADRTHTLTALAQMLGDTNSTPEGTGFNPFQLEPNDLPSALGSLSWRVCVTLMLWVFIRRRAVISTPLQALCWVIADMLAFEWDTHALSIHGAIPYADLAHASAAAHIHARIDPLTGSRTKRTHRSVGGSHTPSMIEADDDAGSPMRFVFNPFPHAAGDAEFTSGGVSVGPMHRVTDTDVYAVLPEPVLRTYRRKCARRRTRAATTTRSGAARPDGTDAEVVPAPAVVSGLAQSLAPIPLRVRGMCVLDVCDPLHNICESVGVREAARMRAALTQSGRFLHTLLLYAAAAARTSSELGARTHVCKPPCSCSHIDPDTLTGALACVQLDSFFAHTWSKYASRGDVHVSSRSAKNQIIAHARTLARTHARACPCGAVGDVCSCEGLDLTNAHVFEGLCGDMSACNAAIEYCALLLDSDVTAPALVSLACEILSDKGALPVGEIGKLLQEATSNVTLSAILKERFGGLKRFIESYPDVFVLGGDHPFNPHVYLKSGMGAAAIKSPTPAPVTALAPASSPSAGTVGTISHTAGVRTGGNTSSPAPAGLSTPPQLTTASSVISGGTDAALGKKGSLKSAVATAATGGVKKKNTAAVLAAVATASPGQERAAHGGSAAHTRAAPRVVAPGGAAVGKAAAPRQTSQEEAAAAAAAMLVGDAYRALGLDAASTSALMKASAEGMDMQRFAVDAASLLMPAAPTHIGSGGNANGGMSNSGGGGGSSAIGGWTSASADVSHAFRSSTARAPAPIMAMPAQPYASSGMGTPASAMRTPALSASAAAWTPPAPSPAPHPGAHGPGYAAAAAPAAVYGVSSAGMEYAARTTSAPAGARGSAYASPPVRAATTGAPGAAPHAYAYAYSGQQSPAQGGGYAAAASRGFSGSPHGGASPHGMAGVGGGGMKPASSPTPAGLPPRVMEMMLIHEDFNASSAYTGSISDATSDSASDVASREPRRRQASAAAMVAAAASGEYQPRHAHAPAPPAVVHASPPSMHGGLSGASGAAGNFMLAHLSPQSPHGALSPHDSARSSARTSARVDGGADAGQSMAGFAAAAGGAHDGLFASFASGSILGMPLHVGESRILSAPGRSGDGQSTDATADADLAARLPSSLLNF